MLLAFAAALTVFVVALSAICGVSIRLCRRLGMDPHEVLVTLGLAEMPPAHPWHRDRKRRLAA